MLILGVSLSDSLFPEERREETEAEMAWVDGLVSMVVVRSTGAKSKFGEIRQKASMWAPGDPSGDPS